MRMSEESVSDHFDATYYLAANSDISENGLDALTHFLAFGWREGRNPSRQFDVAYYIRTNPDVAAAGINPLVHYIHEGAREGRSPRRPLDGLRRSLEAAQPAYISGRAWGGAADNSSALPGPIVFQALASALKSHENLVISVSHDDYERNIGGVQNVIRDERTEFERLGWSYLHLSPAMPLPALAEAGPAGAFRFAMRLNSNRLGVVTAADLMAALSTLRKDETRVLLVVHHLMGHAPESLLYVAELATEPIVIWVHDYFTLCTNHALMRNDIHYCAAPPIATAGCMVCAYRDDRDEQQPRIQLF